MVCSIDCSSRIICDNYEARLPGCAARWTVSSAALKHKSLWKFLNLNFVLISPGFDWHSHLCTHSQCDTQFEKLSRLLLRKQFSFSPIMWGILQSCFCYPEVFAIARNHFSLHWIHAANSWWSNGRLLRWSSLFQTDFECRWNRSDNDQQVSPSSKIAITWVFQLNFKFHFEFFHSSIEKHFRPRNFWIF